MDFHVQSSLILFTISGLILWYLKYLWQRRKLYIYSWNVPGPLNLPFIGVGYMLFWNSDDLVQILTKLIGDYPTLGKAWFGSQLVYSSPDPFVIEQVLTSPKCLEKGQVYKLAETILGTGLLSAPVPIWRKHRKLIRPSFNQKILDSFVEVFAEQSTILTDILKGYVGKKEINICVPVNAMMMDIVCETAMGLKMNTQYGNTQFANLLEICMDIITQRVFQLRHRLQWTFRFYSISKELDKCTKLLLGVVSKVIEKKLELLEKQRELAENSVSDQIEEGGSRKRLAFLDLIIENHELTKEDLKYEVMMFLGAGTDTTAATTCFCLEMLGLYPEIQRRVYEEVIDVVGEERLVEASDLPQLKYMERVIKETLRLFPVGVFFGRMMTEDLKIGNCVIPEGAAFMVSTLNLHRNTEYWLDPLRFDPDRFLPEEVAKRPPCAYIPFSYGPRNCIGMAYGMMSLKTIIATTIRKYRVFTHYRSVEEMEVMLKVMIRLKRGHKVYLETR